MKCILMTCVGVLLENSTNISLHNFCDNIFYFCVQNKEQHSVHSIVAQNVSKHAKLFRFPYVITLCVFIKKNSAIKCYFSD